MKGILARISPFRILLAVGIFMVIGYNITFMSPYTHFAWLAESFMRGQLDIPREYLLDSAFLDISFFNGKYYWPLGLTPALLLVPIVPILGTVVSQAVLQIVLVFAALFFAYRLGVRRGLSVQTAQWLAVGFVFASVVSGVVLVNSPWHVANMTAMVFLLFALHEYSGKDRPYFTGAFVALAMLARTTAGFGSLFFGVVELLSDRPFKERLRRIVLFGVPMVMALLLIGGYNFARFGNAFETGHAYHYLGPGDIKDRFEALGMFDMRNIPRNISYYFIKLPELKNGLPIVDPRGVSVILLSPLFLWLVFARKRSKEFIGSAIVTLSLAPVFLMYFTTGFWQFGPRYLLDILPFWFLVLLMVFSEREFRSLHKSVIVASAFLNIALYVMFTFYHHGLPPEFLVI